MELKPREVLPADVPFIMDSWAKSWRVSPWAGCIPNNRFHEVHRSTVEDLVGRGAKFLVLSPDTQPEVVVGWICYELDKRGITVCHYLYVKDPYKLSQGLQETAGRLLEATPGQKPGLYTHRTKAIVEALGRGWIHAPEVARRK